MAKFLIFDVIPPLIEQEKDGQPNTPVAGAAVAETELVKAFLSYGSCERYYFLGNPLLSAEVSRSRLAQYLRSDKTEIVSADELAALSDLEGVALFSGSSLLQPLVQLRKISGRADWPVVGVTHALSYLIGIPQAVFMLLDEMYDHDAMVCTSHAGRQALCNIFAQLGAHLNRRLDRAVSFAGQLPVIPLGVDVERFRPHNKFDAQARLGIPADSTVFLYFGRFSPADKADLFPLLLTFCTEIVKDPNQATLVLAGNDTVSHMTPKLRSFAAQLGAGEKVLVLPDVNMTQKALLYAAADVFVSLADNVQETFGLTIVEAMAAGLPVVASDWSGYRESVIHGVTGFLAPTCWGGGVESASRLSPIRGEAATHWLLGQSVGSDLRIATRYMKTLLENPQLRASMGKAARARVEALYAWPVIVRQYEELLGKLVERSRARRREANPFRHGLGSYDYIEIFRHYATGVFESDASLRVTETGRRFFEHELRIESLEETMSAPGWEFIEMVAAVYKDEVETPAATLLNMANAAAAESAAQVIMRLIKYGILESVPRSSEPA
jgi:glycosyltransferase involved in cell wall biosynthesis